MKTVSDREFGSVLKLEDRERYAYFIKRAADNQTIWSLYGKDGCAQASANLPNGQIGTT